MLALRKAATVALVSLNAKCSHTKQMKDFVRLSKKRIKMQEKIVACEIKFCDCIPSMTPDDMIHSLFEIFDSDESGFVDIAELAEGLRKLHDMPVVADVMDVAEDIFERYGELSRLELGHFVESLRECMGCSLAEVSELLVQRIAFSRNGEQVLQDHVANLIQGSNGAIGDFQEAITEVRMILLFDMFKHDESGVVPFHVVVKHLLSSGLIDKVPKEILLQLDRSSRRVMDYPEFADLIIGLTEHLASAFPKEVELHDVANDFTMSVLYSDNDALFDAIFSRPGVFGKTVVTVKQFEYEELHFGRIGRLFTIFDVDNDGTIGPHEFVLGMRKIQLAKSLDDLISESINVLFSFDKDGDLVLNRAEFGKLFSSLATTNGVDLQDMLGYMLVKSALHDCSDSEKKYIATVLDGDLSFGDAPTTTKRPNLSHGGHMPGLMTMLTDKSAKVFASLCA